MKHKFTYKDCRHSPAKEIFVCFAEAGPGGESNILEADKKFLEATGTDPSKATYITCAIEQVKP